MRYYNSLIPYLIAYQIRANNAFSLWLKINKFTNKWTINLFLMILILLNTSLSYKLPVIFQFVWYVTNSGFRFIFSKSLIYLLHCRLASEAHRCTVFIACQMHRDIMSRGTTVRLLRVQIIIVLVRVYNMQCYPSSTPSTYHHFISTLIIRCPPHVLQNSRFFLVKK